MTGVLGGAGHADASVAPVRERTSEVVARLARDHAGRNVQIATMINELHDRSFGVLIILFALPNAVIPGISFILGAPVVLFALQMAAGRTSVWLPRFMSGRTIPAGLFQKIATRSERFLRWTEKRTKTRWVWLVTGMIGRALGFYIAVVAAFLMMPVPFGNALPALGISLMSAGQIEKDGKAAAAGMVLGFLGIVYIVAVVAIGVKAFKALLGLL